MLTFPAIWFHNISQREYLWVGKHGGWEAFPLGSPLFCPSNSIPYQSTTLTPAPRQSKPWTDLRVFYPTPWRKRKHGYIQQRPSTWGWSARNVSRVIYQWLIKYDGPHLFPCIGKSSPFLCWTLEEVGGGKYGGRQVQGTTVSRYSKQSKCSRECGAAGWIP